VVHGKLLFYTIIVITSSNHKEMMEMKKTKLILLASLVALLALVSSVSAAQTVVTFDDLIDNVYNHNTPIPAGYAGMTWDPNWFYWSWSQAPYWEPHSPPTRIATHNYGGWFEFSQPVDFKGAYLSGSEGYSQTTCYFEGYQNNVKVGQSSSLLTVNTPTFLAANFPSSVDKVNLVCDNFNYFAVDDITYDDGTIPSPEFPTMALPAAMVVGLLGTVLVLKRTKEE
jgi:hypothetical protein